MGAHQSFLELDHVSKRYALGRHGVLPAPRHPEAVWALRDVSLQVANGECVGLIGPNGAGKTTILRLLAGITRATTGRVRTRGRVASLINLGAGFHPELTGRENIYLNGVILGLSRNEVKARFDQIVEFADLGPYIDTPLKRYSSGMYARLGFAVAAHVDPDVLLVDEVLSVGDVAFQERSIRKMLSFRDSGRATLFVSHNLSAVEMMCARTIWLDHGVVRQMGPTADVVRAYLDAVDEAIVEQADSELSATDQLDVVVDAATIHAGDGHPRSEFDYGDPLGVRLRWSVRREVTNVQCRVTVRGDYGPLITAVSDMFPAWRPGAHTLDCVFEALPLLPGLYRIEVQVGPTAVPETVGAFRVVTDLERFGSQSVVGTTKSRGGFLAVAYDWHVHSTAADESLAGLRLPRTMPTIRRQ